ITPYASAHLGHAFTYHTFDVLTRRLLSLGIDVRSVRNITDVDDDMMRVSRERGISWEQLTEQEIRSFNRQLSAINVLAVDAAPRASERVTEMVRWVQQLVDSQHAYSNDGSVYFDVTTDATYGCFSRLD